MANPIMKFGKIEWNKKSLTSSFHYFRSPFTFSTVTIAVTGNEQ